MRSLAPLALLLALAPCASAQDAPQDGAQRYRVESRLRLLQGEADKLDQGVRDGIVTRADLRVRGSKADELQGELSVSGQEESVAFRGRLDDLLWLGAPRLLGPLARDLRQARAGSRQVRLVVAGQPLVLNLQLRPRLGKEGREVLVTGSGERRLH